MWYRITKGKDHRYRYCVYDMYAKFRLLSRSFKTYQEADADAVEVGGGNWNNHSVIYN